MDLLVVSGNVAKLIVRTRRKVNCGIGDLPVPEKRPSPPRWTLRVLRRVRWVEGAGLRGHRGPARRRPGLPIPSAVGDTREGAALR